MLCIASTLFLLSHCLLGGASAQNVGISEFENFKSSMLSEIESLKERELWMKAEIQSLKLDNTEKTEEIDRLKKQMKTMDDALQDCTKQTSRQRRVTASYGAFTAYIDHSDNQIRPDKAIVYNQVLLNDGGFYNTSTGVYTAPYTGVYLFSYSVGAKIIPGVHLSQYDVFTRLMVGDDYQLSAVAESTATYDDEQGSVTAILMLEEGSKVWTKHEVRGGHNLYADPTERVSSFTGTLLYQTEPLGIIG